MTDSPGPTAVTPVSLPHEDALTARRNLARWLAAEGLDVAIAALDADRRPGFVYLTATLADGRVLTCQLDLAIPYTRPVDRLWPWSWR